MGKKYRSICLKCKKNYHGFGKTFCSMSCSTTYLWNTNIYFPHSKQWNKGLSKSTSEKVRLNAEKISLALKGRVKSSEHKKNLALSSIGRKHLEETKQKIRESILSNERVKATQFKKGQIGYWRGKKQPHLAERNRKYALEHPEKHPNRTMVNVSKGQRFMFDQLKKIFPEEIIELEHYIYTGKKRRYLDVAIPLHRVAFEYDGIYWHKDKSAGIERDKELANIGWRVVHIQEPPRGDFLKVKK